MVIWILILFSSLAGSLRVVLGDVVGLVLPGAVCAVGGMASSPGPAVAATGTDPADCCDDQRGLAPSSEACGTRSPRASCASGVGPWLSKGEQDLGGGALVH